MNEPIAKTIAEMIMLKIRKECVEFSYGQIESFDFNKAQKIIEDTIINMEAK